MERPEKKRRYDETLAAVVLILIGISILWNNLLDLLWYLLPDFLEDIVYTISYRIPQTVLGIAIIVAGVWMIRGKKRELLDEGEKEEDEDEDGRETDGTDA